MNDNVILSKYLTKVFETPSDGVSEWFGYYNYDTLNHDQTKMLCNRSKVDGVAPEKGMTIELGYYDIPEGTWHHIGESDSWNWQQGAMMQWLLGEGNENKVIYNTSKDDHLISRIHNIATGEDRDIDWAIYGITPDGKKSIALDLERSRWCRAYHYKSVENTAKEGRVYEGDGIFEVDLESNTTKRIISIQDIIALNHEPSFDTMKHWLEHIMISPDGSRFVFLHRFSSMENVFHYRTRICIANIDGSNLQVIDGQDKYEWSHFGWNPDNSFCIYAYTKSRFGCPYTIGSLLHSGIKGILKLPKKAFCVLTGHLPFGLSRKIYGNYTYYQFYRQNSEGYYVLDNISRKNFFPTDGHPSFTAEGDVVITDTYADKNKRQLLLAYSPKNRRCITLGKFTDFYKYNPASCDLHPKLCKNNRFIVLDTALDEKHRMIVFEITWNMLRHNLLENK